MSELAVIGDAELMSVLRSSLYPGAKTESIKLVLSYCKATGLDPMQKPVHIVPMWDSKAGEMRDVVMPGIGLYRTQAARSGDYAGVTEPEFGEDVTEQIGGVEITYPKSCKVTVKRKLADGSVADYTASERWKENYAVKGGKEKSLAPNAMWMRRPYGQLAKCAQAQALRMAFPELGAQPTADEMEGKYIDDGSVIEGALVTSSSKPATAAPKSKTQIVEAEIILADASTVTPGQQKLIRVALGRTEISETELLVRFKSESIEALLQADINTILDWIKNPADADA